MGKQPQQLHNQQQELMRTQADEEGETAPGRERDLTHVQFIIVYNNSAQ